MLFEAGAHLIVDRKTVGGIRMTDNDLSSNKPKRFYKEAAAVSVEDGFAIHLDGRPVRTPLGSRLVVPGQPLAEAIATEWRQQEDAIVPSSMPLCGYVNTAIDRVGEDRRTVFETLMKFADTDLLCYRADEPVDLVKEQMENWQPLLDWAAESLGVALQVTVGILPVKQPVEAMDALKGKLSGLDNMELTAVASLAAACGSLILALALLEGRINAERAFSLSQLDEDFQSERWGMDSEARAIQEKLKENIASAALLLTLHQQ